MIILFITSLIGIAYTITDVPLDYNRNEYLELISQGKFDDTFKRGKPLANLSKETCLEINKAYEGKLYDENGIVSQVLIEFKLNCNKSSGEKHILLSFKKPNNLNETYDIEVTDIYKLNERGLSFISPEFLIKAYRWNNFRNRKGVNQIMIFNRKSKKIFINRSALSNGGH